MFFFTKVLLSVFLNDVAKICLVVLVVGSDVFTCLVYVLCSYGKSLYILDVYSCAFVLVLGELVVGEAVVVVIEDALLTTVHPLLPPHTCLQLFASHLSSHVLPSSHTCKHVFTPLPHFRVHVLFCKHACWQSSASHWTFSHFPMAHICVQFVAWTPKQWIFVQWEQNCFDIFRVEINRLHLPSTQFCNAALDFTSALTTSSLIFLLFFRLRLRLRCFLALLLLFGPFALITSHVPPEQSCVTNGARANMFRTWGLILPFKWTYLKRNTKESRVIKLSLHCGLDLNSYFKVV